MRILNPFGMNDWNIRKFLIFIISFQLIFLGTIGLDYIGLGIPLLREFICFIYLLYIPGVLILRILKLHKLGDVESLLYSVGLSISFLMFIGLLMNTFAPTIGMLKPISTFPLAITISIVILFLCALCYKVNQKIYNASFFDIKDLLSIPAMCLYLIPLLTAIGTYFLNINQNNLLLILSIFLISCIILIIGYTNFIPNKLYPLTVFIVAFSLLIHRSLISMYLVGWDIQIEYYMANNVINNSLWDSTIYSNVNSMLSIVMFAPIFSQLSSMELTWVFKIVYPIIFSLVPVGLYQVFQKHTDGKIALLSVFFFVSLFVYYTEMTQLARQQIAEYYLILVILLLFDDNANNTKSRFLLVVFSFSTIVSHYGLSYIFIATIFSAWFLAYIYYKYFNKNTKSTISTTFVLVSATFLISWYMYITDSSALISIVHIVDNIISNFFSDMLNPNSAQGLYIISSKTSSSWHDVGKYLQIISQVLISFGLFYQLIKQTSNKYSTFNMEYLFLSTIFYIMLIASVIVPNFSSALNTSRIYQISLILLTPFCAIGGIAILEIMFKNTIILRKKQFSINPIKLVSIFFALFLLFNSGWVYELINDKPTSISLNNTIDYPKYNEQEVLGKDWLYKQNNEHYVYADSYRWLLFLSCYSRNQVRNLPMTSSQMVEQSYLYMSTYNILTREVLVDSKNGVNSVVTYIKSEEYISHKSQIYDNGGAIIYY